MSRLLSVATLSVALFSCADEEIVGGGPRVQEGSPGTDCAEGSFRG